MNTALLSMTGYGKGEVTRGDKTISVEVRSLNGKLGDIRIKTPYALGSRELELRKLIQEHAVRGKIDITIEVHDNTLAHSGLPDQQLIQGYLTALRRMSEGMQVSDDAIFQAVLRLPNLFQNSNGEMTDEDWAPLAEATLAALESLRRFRIAEGLILRHDLKARIEEILTFLNAVDADEGLRQAALRERLQGKLSELRQEGLDANRLEQEMLYYLDKLDVNEEKVRLRQHCLYFLEAMDSNESVKGKKLNFISQEIGREMNTLGAKAQWTSMQHNVVAMKNALEEIKEQLANAL